MKVDESCAVDVLLRGTTRTSVQPRSNQVPARTRRERQGDRDSHVIIWTCHRVSHRDILGQIWQLRGRSKEPIGREGDASAPYRPLGLCTSCTLSNSAPSHEFGSLEESL